MAFEKEAKALADKAPAEDGDGADSEMSSYDDVEDSAASELASLAGVKDVEAFKSALGDYVKACVDRAMGGSETEAPAEEAA